MSKKIVIGIFALLVITSSYALHYVLPRYMLVEITGADSKRAEGIPRRGAEVTAKGNDIYFIYVTKQDGTAGVLRNEDTGWGMPPYFKFNAADVQAKAQSLKGKWLQVGYYGWRNQMLGLFPNVLSIREAKEGDPQSSWIRNSVFTLWWTALLIFFPRFYSVLTKAGTSLSKSRSKQEGSGHRGLLHGIAQRARRKNTSEK